MLLHSAPIILILKCFIFQLHWIASNGRTELLIEILPYVKNIDIEGFNGQTPLHLACLTGHKTVSASTFSSFFSGLPPKQGIQGKSGNLFSIRKS